MIAAFGIESLLADLMARFGLPIAKAGTLAAAAVLAFNASHVHNGLIAAARGTQFIMYGVLAFAIMFAFGVFDGVTIQPVLDLIELGRSVL